MIDRIGYLSARASGLSKDSAASFWLDKKEPKEKKEKKGRPKKKKEIKLKYKFFKR